MFHWPDNGDYYSPGDQQLHINSVPFSKWGIQRNTNSLRWILWCKRIWPNVFLKWADFHWIVSRLILSITCNAHGMLYVVFMWYHLVRFSNAFLLPFTNDTRFKVQITDYKKNPYIKLRQESGIRICNFCSEMIKSHLAETNLFLDLFKPSFCA